MSAHGTKKTVYEIVTEQILKALQQGIVPWRKPWATGFHDPMNISGRRYRGINRVLLGLAEFASPVWLTWKQIQERGGHVKRGEHAQLVVYWMERNRALPGSDGAAGETRGAGRADSREKPGRPSDEAEQSGRTGGIIPLYYRVFNVEQTEGIEVPEALQPPRAAFTQSAREILSLADGIVRTMPNPPSIGMGGERAYYRPSTDHIQMPPHDVFRDAAGYATTLFHEATHATGHPSRLGRLLPDALAPFGSADYSREELIAEIGACFLLRRTGIGSDVTNSTAYIRGWLKALQENPTWVIGAATQAQRASDYILGPEEPRTPEHPQGGDGDAERNRVTPSVPPVPTEKTAEGQSSRSTPARAEETRDVVVTSPRMAVARPASAASVPAAQPVLYAAPSRSSASVAKPRPQSASKGAEASVPFPPFLTTGASPLEVTVDRNRLAEAWTRVRKAVPRQHSSTPLTHVHVQAAEGAVILTGTDLDWVRQERIPAEVVRGGVVTVAAAPVQTLLSKLRGVATLQLTELEGAGLEVRAGTTRYRIPGGPAGKYPAPYLVSEKAQSGTIPAAPWARGLSRVSHAMGDDETRRHLCGVYVDPTADGLRLVATDGHRLALVPVGAGDLFDSVGRILPRVVVPSLAAMLREAATATVRWDSAGVEFQTGSSRLMTRWIDGEFPDYERILPAEHAHPARVRVADLRGALERVRAMTSDRKGGVRLELTAGQLAVASTGGSDAEAFEPLPAEYDGPDVQVGFNAGYLLDVLEVAKGAEELLFSLRDGLSQASFRIEGDPDLVAIVMPMRL